MGNVWSLKSELDRNTVLTISLGFIDNYNSGKIRHHVLVNLLCWLLLHLFIEEWLNQTQFVRYYTKIYFGFLMILSVHKSDTMCQLSYCVVCVYIMSLKIDLNRHTLLAVSLRFILFSLHDFPGGNWWYYVLAN